MPTATDLDLGVFHDSEQLHIIWEPEVDTLRLLVGEKVPVGGSETDTFFTNVDLANLLHDAAGYMNRAALWGWQMKAANYASLVDVSEGGSSRRLSLRFRQAQEMIKLFDMIVKEGQVRPPVSAQVAAILEADDSRKAEATTFSEPNIPTPRFPYVG